MRRRGWKVPTVLVAVALLAACGREAESAAETNRERVIPPAEPAAGAPATEPGAEAGVEPGDAAPSAGATVEAAPSGDRPVAAPPTAVVRSDPEPSVAPSRAGRSRPEATEPPPASEEARSGTAVEAAEPAEPAEVAEVAPEPAPVFEPLTAPVGTRVSLTVAEELSTKVSATGDAFVATVSEDVLGGDGVVVLHRGTRVRGRVLESYESPSSDRPATLALGVESVEVGGRTIPVVATVTELEHETEARDSDGRSAAKVGAGAVAGALLGKIIGGDGKDAVKGAVAGALAGAAVAHATRDGHARVPPGARMVIVLDQPLVLEPGGPVG